jgi:cyclopropane-fatty-acyl-phospholipid synthase
VPGKLCPAHIESVTADRTLAIYGIAHLVVSMDRLLRYFLQQFIRRGAMTFTTASGAKFSCGDGTGEPICVRFLTTDAERRVLINPELALGEVYMEGTFVVEKGSIADALAILMDQPEILPRWAKLQWWLRYLGRHAKQFNPRGRSKNNVAHHYDLDGRLYSLFLDADKQYSCAYFETADAALDDAQLTKISLDDAQLAKKRHLAAKLLIGHGDRVLDIGSGWGGLGLYLAEMTGANVTGVTLSTEQLAVSNARAAEKNLAASAKFFLEDYRDISGPFDRIVSVGMFEHVGVDFYETYFRRCAELLTDDGVMMLHSIGRSNGPDVTSPWTTKYIFPGGYIPALSEVIPAIERSGLLVCDIEILRLHYAETLKAWRERFMARREEAVRLYDERFARMWEFYLAGSEMSFRKQNLMNFQIQLSKRQGVVPMTRDYIAQEEAKLRGIERGKRPRLQIAGE